jgi:hypothetical protein
MSDEIPKAAVTANAEVSAKFQATAGQSQTVLLSLVGIDLILFLISAYFFAVDKIGAAVLFFLLGAVSFGALFFMWSRSQADSDLAAAVPTSITAADGTKLSTDVRALASPKALDNLLKVVEVLLNRRPLPRPAGLVGPQGELIPGTEAAANIAVENINRNTLVVTDEAIDELGLSDPNTNRLSMHIPEEPPRALLDATPPPETNVSTHDIQNPESTRHAG